jgi:hypothetical protein
MRACHSHAGVEECRMARAIAVDAVLDAARGGSYVGRFGAFRIVACRRLPPARERHRVSVDLYVWFEGLLVECSAQSIRFTARVGAGTREKSAEIHVEPAPMPTVFRKRKVQSPWARHRRPGIRLYGLPQAPSASRARRMHVKHPPRPQGRTNRHHLPQAGDRKVRR